MTKDEGRRKSEIRISKGRRVCARRLCHSVSSFVSGTWKGWGRTTELAACHSSNRTWRKFGRVIQRFGRIDRIGSDHDVVYGFNFLPETGLDRNLGLKQKLQNRIQEIHDTIGEDSEILDRTEKLNEEAMYAIYEKKNGGQLRLFEDEEDEFLDLNEAEEILRQLRRENPGEYERITDLRDGIRAAKTSTHKGQFVFCEAASPERETSKGFQQLFLLDA